MNKNKPRNNPAFHFCLVAAVLLGAFPALASFGEPLFTPVFEEDQIVFATVVATDAPYFADPKGKGDSTDAINRAMDRVRQRGGGACYLPAGHYRVDGYLKIPATVTLVGDWKRPQPGEPISGTILMARAGRGDVDGTPFISISGPKQGDLRGMTIWYPEQTGDEITPYSYTIEGNVSHIRKITLVNSYRGIRMKDNSGSVVSDIYGTVLETGIEARSSTEFCRIFNVKFSPEFWLKAGIPFRDKPAASESAKRIDDFVAANLVALKIGKSDGLVVYNVDAKPARAVLDATMVEAERKAMVGNPNSYGFGGLVWKSPGARLRTGWNAWYFGAHYGDLDRIPELPDALYPFSPQCHPAKMDKDSIYVATDEKFGAKGDGKADDTVALRKALAAAAAVGGGTVYLPHGVYRLTAPLNIPPGVELRGPLATGQVRVWFEPCTLLVDWLPSKSEDIFTSPAAVTLSAGAGLRGLTISHTINIWETDSSGKLVITPMPFAIRSAGPDTYIQDVTLTNAYLGIDLASHKCDRFQIKDLWATALREGIRVGGGTVGGSIEIATIDFGPWHGWKRVPKEADTGVLSRYNQWIHDHLDTFVFEDCSEIDAFSLAGFFPKTHLIFRGGQAVPAGEPSFWQKLFDGSSTGSGKPGMPKNIRLWMSMFDVARDASVFAGEGDRLGLFGLFVTGGDSGLHNWLEFGPQFSGALDLFGPVVQPIFFNRPLGDAPEGFKLRLGTSLTGGRPVTASSAPNPEHPAAHAVDRDAASYWESAPGVATLTVDLGESRKLDRWRLVGHGVFGSSNKNPWAATFQTSEDGVNFADVDSFDDNITPVVERPLPAGTKARFVRVRFDRGESPLGFNRARIHQFDVYEAE